MQFVRREVKISVLLMLVLSLFPQTSHAETQTYADYKAPDGIEIISYSSHWADTQKLAALHQELLQNAHGSEIRLLKAIEIYDDYPHGTGEGGQYDFTTETSPLAKPKMLPGTIELYGGRDHLTVASFAHTLAHEYGHHVTQYYTLQTDGIALSDAKRWQDTTYARLRGLSNDPRVGVQGVAHRWQLPEIAAEDYVQLFGSPLAKQQTPFQDRAEQVLAGQEPSELAWDSSMYNVSPQENTDLPLASDAPALYDFFNKQMHKGSSGTFTAPAKPVLQLASATKQGDLGYQLHFAWTEKNEQPSYTYTLVTYSDGDALAEPIVTRQASDPHQALYGPAVVQKGNILYSYQDPSAHGLKHFKLYAFDAHGHVSDSAVLTVDLAHPGQVQTQATTVNPLKPLTPSQQTSSVQLNDSNSVVGLLDQIFGVVKDLIVSVANLLQNVLS